MIRCGSVSLEGSAASVLMPSSVSVNTRFREFTLRPIMKYAVTAFLPSCDFPITIPLPGYALPFNSSSNEIIFTLFAPPLECLTTDNLATSQDLYELSALHNSTQTRSRSLPHIADTKFTAPPTSWWHSSLSTDVLQWSAYELVNADNSIYIFICCQIVIYLFIFNPLSLRLPCGAS